MSDNKDNRKISLEDMYKKMMSTLPSLNLIIGKTKCERYKKRNAIIRV